MHSLQLTSWMVAKKYSWRVPAATVLHVQNQMGTCAFGKECLWAHSFSASHYSQLLGGILLFVSLITANFTFFLLCGSVLTAYFLSNGSWLKLSLFKTQVLVRIGLFWERKCHLSVLCYHLTFPESPKACLLITCKILIIRLLILSDYSNRAHIHQTFN